MFVLDGRVLFRDVADAGGHVLERVPADAVRHFKMVVGTLDALKQVELRAFDAVLCARL